MLITKELKHKWRRLKSVEHNDNSNYFLKAQLAKPEFYKKKKIKKLFFTGS